MAGVIGTSALRLNTDDIWSWWWSPGGEWISYTIWDEKLDEELQLWVVRVDGSDTHQVASNIAYDFEGEKVYDYRWQPVER